MKLTEENQLLLSAAREFAEREVRGIAVDIERSGIPQQVLGKMAEMGFLGATAPDRFGGASLGTTSYLLLLETLSRYSPSLAFYTYLQNTLVIGSLIHFQDSEAAGESIRDVSSGKRSGTVVLDELVSNTEVSNVSIADGDRAVSGSAGFVMHPDASFLLLSHADAEGSSLFQLNGGVKQTAENRRLGFRGLGFGRVSFASSKEESVLLGRKSGQSVISLAASAGSMAVAAIALGIAEETVDRAAAYSKTRKTFGSRLEEYRPVAYSLSSMMAETEVLREYIYSSADGGEKEGLVAKLLMTDAAVRASKLSMQVHGGNGYFEEYQIEKYYRDAMALEALTGNRNSDLGSLARQMLGSGSASI